MLSKKEEIQCIPMAQSDQKGDGTKGDRGGERRSEIGRDTLRRDCFHDMAECAHDVYTHRCMS